MPHASLNNPPGDLIGGAWIQPAGATLESRNPARPEQVVWSGRTDPAHVDAAVAAARRALPFWSTLAGSAREAVLRRFAELAAAQQQRVAEVICDEVGKVMWEARQEAALLSAKIDSTLDASPEGGRRRVTDFSLALGTTRQGRCLFRPHGVIGVLGPFNFPVHLPNGHIAPALLMGNTIVFKPSDKAPACGQALIELFQQALREAIDPLPPEAAGVINLVQGGVDIASTLVRHEGLDGIALTGSWPVGRAVLEANLDRPGRIVALELGGNNPVIVMPDADLRQAAIEIVRGAFNTTGQRCTCTRRAIIHASVADRLIPAIGKAASNLIIGDPRAAHPVFMGPMVSAPARDAVLRFQDTGRSVGSGEVLVPCMPVEVAGCAGGFFVSPGVMRVERFGASTGDAPTSREQSASADVEVFGPLLRVSVCDSLDDALEQANATRFGLAASIFTRDAGAIERFLVECRAGCLNVNTGTSGASGKLPFGGLGYSGNHRPAGSFALDYCAYPVAAMIESGQGATIAEGMRFEADWIR
ncbi:MAG: aldehyde dehydrogenase family protein [Phycisphaerales bacterium]